jgi:hypothetical protein
MDKHPKIYELVIEKMYIKSFKGKLDSGKARHILGSCFHVHRSHIIPILKEMEEYGLIEIPENVGGRYIFVVWKPKYKELERFI